MISRFFIDRPIFATVLSVIITLTGGIALFYLPVAQYPRITPPGVSISISYPGASAQVVADTVAAPIEQQVTGVDGMLYMSSQSGNDGTYSLTVTFDVGTDLNTALVMVQNRVALAMRQLPTQVQNQGITIRKKTPDILLIVNFYSPKGRYDDIHLSNYATVNVRDELLRVDGVSDITYQGQRDYSIRAWLDPQKLAARGMTAIDVANAIRTQNVDAPAGRIGQPPTSPGQSFQLPLDTLGRLTDPDQFGEIVVKVGGSPPVLSPTGMVMGSPQGGAMGGASTDTSLTMPPATSSPPAPTSSGGSSSSSGGTSGSTSSGSVASGGGTTGGGASTGGGGTTGGGATTGGGGTSGGGLTGGGLTNTAITVGGGNAGGTVGAAALSGGALGGGPPSPASALVRLRHVARLERGAQNYSISCTFDGHPSVGLGVYQLPGTNALDVADRVRAKMEELKEQFPDDLEYKIAYDTTPFIRESVNDVVNTLLEAVAVVGLVVLVFLQDWRAMILPMIDVPVSLIGTFAVMAALGFSLNNISLFGLVLAIGIVVDDAIVVLENIERQIAKGYDPRTATIKAMEEVTGPIVAVGLVLCAVFVPCAFIRGITGQFFRQFAVTISVSTVISAINAITMTPSRAVLIFKSAEGGKGHQAEALPWWFFGAVGGLLTWWLGPKLLQIADWRLQIAEGQSAIFNLQSAILFTPGALVGGVIGWFLIHPVNGVLGAFFRGFNRAFDGLTAVYAWTVGKLIRVNVGVLFVYGGLLVLTFWVFQKAPTGFIPQQDQGRLIVNIQLPDSSSLERTQEAVAQIDQIARDTPGVGHTVAIAGLSFLLQANSPNFASMFIVLDPFDKRQRPELRDTAIMAHLRKEWARQVKDAQVTVYGASPVPGLGVAGGFKFLIEDRAGLGVAALQTQTDDLIRRLQGNTFRLTDTALAALRSDGVPGEVLEKLAPLNNKEFDGEKSFTKEVASLLDKDAQERYGKAVLSRARRSYGLNSVTTQFRSNTPQVFLDIDRAKAASLGVSLDDVNQTLDMYLGSLYVNSYNEFGRHWQVTIQADAQFRNRVENINLFQVRNKAGQMVSLGTLVTPREIGGPVAITRYNLYTAAAINGNVAPGGSTGDAIKAIDDLADETLPLSMRVEWTELMFMQIKAGNTAMYVFALAVISVFLALAGLYESWSLPLAVILVVPLCLLCSVAGVRWTDRDVNIFVQIGLVVLVGLACKNAILIVEFAKQLHQEGRPRFEATKEASRLRLRPILMTSFAFIFGVVPLVLASGAGAEMRRSLGTAVFSGMLGVTLFGIFLTPIFFYVILGLGQARLFQADTTQSVISHTAGGLLGGAVGFLLAQLHVGRQPWGPLVGAFAGVLVVRAVRSLRQRIRPRNG
ncbi:MAG TPA: efflux RND transporter permease subunit [Gemmataceae bacterium]|nr:efflux RND transporter permease subunit [Gemmataceae bacterium]